MNDNQEYKTYFFSFKTTVGQYIDSPHPEDETKEMLLEFARQVNGEDDVEVVEFREVTQEELEALLPNPFFNLEDTTPTIN